MSEPRGIEGLIGKAPIGVALTCGVKMDRNPKGFPTGTDRYYLVNPKEEGGIRAPHPAFAEFNEAPTERRKVIHGNIVHASEELCWDYSLRAQVLRSAANPDAPAHPDKRPVCTGDGVRAVRWMGGAADNFKEIACPHDQCQFRQKWVNKAGKEQPAACKPSGHILFMLRWDAEWPMLPPMLAKFDTGAWRTTTNFVGFFDYLRDMAAGLGLIDYTLFGFPFTMTLQKETKPSATSKFPVSTITPAINPIEFFMHQREKIRQLAQSVPFIAITDRPVRQLIDHDASLGARGLSVPAADPAPMTLDTFRRHLNQAMSAGGWDEAELRLMCGGPSADVPPESRAGIVARLARKS